MIKANRTRLGVSFFNLYAVLQLRRNFKQIHINGGVSNTNKPILMISNHFCWWDGFIQIYLNDRKLQKRFHVMMLEEQLCKHMILNKTGAYSVKKNSKSAIQSLNYSVDLLRDARNLVLLFPQGEIESLYTPWFRFEKGLTYILKRLECEVELVFNVNLIDYFSDKKPSLTINYKTFELSGKTDLETIEQAFNAYAEVCRQKQSPL